jgi:hypothetical protein
MAGQYRFIQTPFFSFDIDETGELDLLEAIEAEITRNPEGGALLKAGIRKIRVASTKRDEGKSGGYRVWFYHHKPEDMLLLLLLDKREAADLTFDQEKQLAKMLKDWVGGKRQ